MKWHPGPAQGNDPVARGDVLVGDRFLVLVGCIENRMAGIYERTYWDATVIVATETGWDDAEGDAWGAWDWSDVEWFVKLDKENLPPI